HGSAGHDMMDATAEALEAMSRFLAAHGVTSFLPTTVAASRERTSEAIANVSRHGRACSGAQPLGVHLEGPYLNPDQRGAQPPQHLRPPDPAEFSDWLASGAVRLMTLAPELPGALELIDRGHREGIEFALGHTAAAYEQVLEAADHGLRQASHTFNGMPALHHRSPGTLGAVLADGRLYAQVIVDGVHVHPAIAKVLFRAKGVNRTILISDAMRAAGLNDGLYDLGGQSISVRGGVARTAAGSLAGSTLSLDAAVRNALRCGDMSLPQALPMATSVPAAAMGLAAVKGRLAPGADADVVLLDDALNVRLTIVAGQVVHDRLN
ncbi:MAG: N-acetylglucosamine-6-phosphate deacetylase, partial [Thiobacillaceae bacterium]